MKLSLPISIILSFLTLALFPSCSSDNDNEVWIEVAYNNLGVTTFSLNSNDSVLRRLDSVFFSIDLDKARIFNADSLPKGTRPRALTLNIGLPSVSRAMIYYTGWTGRDSVNYLENSTDTVNFMFGPATLSITSLDGTLTRDYTIEVNVHKQDPDSLAWGETAMRPLPTTLAAPILSHTTYTDGTYYCLTAAGSEACMATATDIQGDWTTRAVTLPEGAYVNSLSSAAGRLFILDTSDRLHISTDGGATWSSTGASMTHIYGAYGDELLGCGRRADGTYVQLSYPSATDAAAAKALPDGCPVSGTSNLIVYTTQWAENPTAITTGGTDASGRLTGSSWAYDGNGWADISIAPGLPRSGMGVVPYYGYRPTPGWGAERYDVLIAFGGVTDGDAVSNQLWVSYDRGLHWTQGRVSMQLPAHIPPMRDASVFVADQTITLSSRNDIGRLWSDFPAVALPSRASVDTSWVCPYIYIMGGYDFHGNISPKIWRGAINRLTYRPLF